MKNLLFLIPVYNDWKSLDLLLKKIELELKKKNYISEILIVNDASTIKRKINVKNLFNIKNIFILNTKKNWIVTYNNCEYIKNMYKNYIILDVNWSYSMNASKISSEIVIISK